MGGWFEWLVPLLAHKLLLYFLPLLCSLFYLNQRAPPSNFLQQISPTFGCIPANKPSIPPCFLRSLTVLLSCMEHSVEEVLTVDLSAYVVGAGRLLIARNMNNITDPTDTRTEPGYKLNCTQMGTVGGARDWINSMAQYRYSPVF